MLQGFSGVKTLNTKMLFAARRRSKKTAGKMANSGTNAVIAASVLTAENGSIYKRFGRTTARAADCAQLAAQHGCSCKTIYRHLRRARIRETFPQPAKANIIMDTTYFGRSFGVMVLMDSISGQVLPSVKSNTKPTPSMPKR